jgi:CrcB protein
VEFGGSKPYLLVAVGGAAGSLCRYLAAVLFGPGPTTTFGVNIAGSFLIGLLAGSAASDSARLLLGTGVLGGFTTFSAWQLEAVLAARSRTTQVDAAWILFGSLGAGFAACWTGYMVAERLR